MKCPTYITFNIALNVLIKVFYRCYEWDCISSGSVNSCRLFRVSVLCTEELWLDWAYSREAHTVWQRRAPQEDPFHRQWRSVSVSFLSSLTLAVGLFLCDDEKNSGWRFHKSVAMLQFLFTVFWGDCHPNLIPARGRSFLITGERK